MWHPPLHKYTHRLWFNTSHPFEGVSTSEKFTLTLSWFDISSGSGLFLTLEVKIDFQLILDRLVLNKDFYCYCCGSKWFKNCIFHLDWKSDFYAWSSGFPSFDLVVLRWITIHSKCSQNGFRRQQRPSHLVSNCPLTVGSLVEGRHSPSFFTVKHCDRFGSSKYVLRLIWDNLHFFCIGVV